MKLTDIKFDNYKDEFKDLIKELHSKYSWFSVGTPETSIHNTEMFFIYCYIKHFKPSLVFETGTFQGRSTLFLAEATKGIAKMIVAAIEETTAEGKVLTRDLGGIASTQELTETVVRKIKKSR